MRAERMMKKMVRGPVVAVGRAGHQNDGQILGISAADRIECRERADAEGDDGSRCTPRPGIALGAEAAIQLVAAINLLQVFVGQELVEQGEVVVAGNREMMLQTNLREPCRKIAANRVLHGKRLRDLRRAFATRVCDCNLSRVRRGTE